MTSFDLENSFAGEQQSDINAEIAALYEAGREANQRNVQTATAPPADATNISPQYRTSPMGHVFLQARRAIRMLGIRIQELNEDNQYLSQMVDANNYEYERLISINNNEFQHRDGELEQRDTELHINVSTLEKRLQSQGNELAHERSQKLNLARQLEQAEQKLVARNGQLGQQMREGARVTQVAQQLQQMLEAQKNELTQRWAEDLRKSADQIHLLRETLAKTQKNLKREQEEKFKYAQAASDCHRILQGYTRRSAPSAVFGNGPSCQSPTNLPVPNGPVADLSYQTPIVGRIGTQAQADAQAHPGGKASSSVIKIDLTIDDDDDGPPTTNIEPNTTSSQSEASRQRQNPDAYEALREKTLPWYEGEHPLKVTKNPGAYGTVVGRAAREANHQPASVTRRTKSRKGISAERKLAAAAERKQRVIDKKIAKAAKEKAKQKERQKEPTNMRNRDMGGPYRDPSDSRTPTVDSSQDDQEENDGLEDELDAALAQQSVAQPHSATVPDNLEEDDGLEDELEAALAQESVTQAESAIVPNGLEVKNGLVEEFGTAFEQAEQQFAVELERVAAAEAKLEVAPVAGNLSLSFEQTITDGGGQISSTPNQHKRKIDADNDNGEGPSTKRYRPILPHEEEEILWEGKVDWDLSDSENQAGTDWQLEIDLDPPTWGGQ